MQQDKFSISRQLKSFRPAITGIKAMVRTQPNAKIHLTATIVVTFLAFLLKVSVQEGMMIVFATGFVWAAEMFNTCIEKTMDFISTERKPEIKFIKDVAAGAVLIAALTALLIGLFIFIPKI